MSIYHPNAPRLRRIPRLSLPERLADEARGFPKSQRKDILSLLLRLEPQIKLYELGTKAQAPYFLLARICKGLIDIDLARPVYEAGDFNQIAAYNFLVEKLNGNVKKLRKNEKPDFLKYSEALRKKISRLVSLACENCLPLPGRFNGQSYRGLHTCSYKNGDRA